MIPFSMLQQVVDHTPVYVWGLLMFCLVMGVKQSQDQQLSRQRLLIVPAIWTAFGLWGVASAFGLQAQNLAAWALGLGLVIATLRQTPWPRGVSFDRRSGLFHVPGSWGPMVMIMAIFMAKYLVGASLAMLPQLAQATAFGLAVSALYGALSGLFIARSLSILRHGGGAVARLSAA
ncbi:MAG: hypothetical protein IV092_14525 [Burkholderiaceae bacterium]|nr:hypothetical protein [Burkholderiaceae bacterium]